MKAFLQKLAGGRLFCILKTLMIEQELAVPVVLVSGNIASSGKEQANEGPPYLIDR